MIICNSFASENYKQLQKSKKFKIGEGSSLKWVKKDKTNIKTKSFNPKNICDNEKYIPTTKYVAITPLQNVKKNISEPLIFKRGSKAKVIVFA